MNTPMQPQWEKKSRFLTQLLIWSGALNIGLGFSLGYLLFQHRLNQVAFELAPHTSSVSASSCTNASTFFHLMKLSWDELIEELDHLKLLEDGYRQRDLALSLLISCHGFDIERAITHSYLQKRKLTFVSSETKEGGQKVSCMVYSGLTEDHFQAIKYFIKTEAFPFTAEKLFKLIKQHESPLDQTLLDTFYLTSEFTFLHTLFVRGGIHVPKPVLIQMIKEGKWSTLHTFANQQKITLNLSKDELHALLLNYIQQGSLIAAKILLQWDREFVLKRMADEELIHLIGVFKEMTPSLKELLKEVMTSPRSDAVWKISAKRLYEEAKLPFPLLYDHKTALETVAIEKLAVSAVESIQKHVLDVSEYVIQKGDNLWKIAKRHQISIEDIYRLNSLESDHLREGKILILPYKGQDQIPLHTKGGTLRAALE